MVTCKRKLYTVLYFNTRNDFIFLFDWPDAICKRKGLIPFSLVKKATALMESEMKAATLWIPFSAAWEVLLFNCFTASAVRNSRSFSIYKKLILWHLSIHSWVYPLVKGNDYSGLMTENSWNYEISPAPWRICVGGSMVKDDTENDRVCWVAAYLSGHNLFIQMKINSSAPSQKKLQYKVVMRNIVTIRPAGCKEKKKRRRKRKNLNKNDYTVRDSKQDPWKWLTLTQTESL